MRNYGVTDLALGDGRTLHVYDTGTGDGTTGLAVFWQHGTPSTGAPPEPLFAAAAERGIRWVSHDRPGYGGSTPRPGRDVASTADDVASIADALGIDRFAVMGASGGAPHALACAAILPGRVLATVCMSAPAPFGAEGLDWFAGMAPSNAAEYRAAATGRAALEAHLASAEFDPAVLTPADHAAVLGPWSWLGTVAAKALATDEGGLVHDDLAYVTAWGCDPRQISTPVLFVHGAQDRLVPSSHATWLAQRCRTAELWMRPDDGHVSILNSSVTALDWLREHASHR
jgi:pimeloyl-ACP methyl ester carboxylesterase